MASQMLSAPTLINTAELHESWVLADLEAHHRLKRPAWQQPACWLASGFFGSVPDVPLPCPGLLLITCVHPALPFSLSLHRHLMEEYMADLNAVMCCSWGQKVPHQENATSPGTVSYVHQGPKPSGISLCSLFLLRPHAAFDREAPC